MIDGETKLLFTRRYQVRSSEGPLDPQADYLVLRLDEGNKHVLAALEAYAKSLESEAPLWAKDLKDKLIKYRRSPRVDLE